MIFNTELDNKMTRKIIKEMFFFKRLSIFYNNNFIFSKKLPVEKN
ncbi:MAG: hypothetical protein ACD_61C00051G0002 [uncultured bacterium]|nr:MAG: hypothetical protein ACD_61C00051G0002 [uncultured bacterium]